MGQSEAKNPLVVQLGLLLDEVDELSVMLEQGFGDKAFRRKLQQISSRAKVLRTAISSTHGDPAQDKEENIIPDAGISHEPMMVLGPDGEQRPATPEDLEALKEAGAPALGSQDRTDFSDGDFGGGRGLDESNDVI